MTNNITTFTSMLQAVNTNAGGYFWTGILYMISIIILVATIPFGITTALYISAFAGLVLGALLVMMGLVNIIWVGVYVAIVFLIAFYSTSSRGD